jgi:hypothetical protein
MPDKENPAMARIHVNTSPVANQYAAPNEKIIEYSVGGGSKLVGGLIAFRVLEDGKLVIDLYRHDADVEIRVGAAPEGV